MDLEIKFLVPVAVCLQNSTHYVSCLKLYQNCWVLFDIQNSD